MKDQFEVAAGGVIGMDHRKELGEKNGQDGFVVRFTPFGIICIVTDGCSTVIRDERAVTSHSEVGAKVGGHMLAEVVARHLARWKETMNLPFTERSPVALLKRIRADTLAQLRVLVNQMGTSLTEIVNDFFLFTVVGIVITPWGTITFSIGDGVIVVNDEVTVLGPFPGNQPPYLAYGLVETSLASTDPDALEFRIHRILPPEALESFLIGCDGVGDLIRVEGANLPGRMDTVGPLSQFWRDDAFFANSDAVRRRLALMNRVVFRPDWTERRVNRESGLLPDDTTLISGRRKRLGGS